MHGSIDIVNDIQFRIFLGVAISQLLVSVNFTKSKVTLFHRFLSYGIYIFD